MAKFISDVVTSSLNIDRVERPEPLIRAGVFGGVIFILAVILWVSVAPISGAIMGSGVVEVHMSRKTVQHQEGGIISKILVRNGSKVKAGQTLVVLKDVSVDAGNEVVLTQLHAQLAKAARFAAEQLGASEIIFPAELISLNTKPRAAEWLDREVAIFNTRKTALASQIMILNGQITEASDEIDARLRQLQADDRSIELQLEELLATELLADQGFISNTQMLALRREAAQYNSRRAEGAADLARAYQNVSGIKLRVESLQSSFKEEASTEFRQATAAIFELRERLRPAQDAEQRQRISAPIAGEVVDLRVTSEGGVIAPREIILDIVPDNADLMVKARIKPEDINYVQMNSDADVRLSAFRQRITPTVKGTVIYISADRLTDSMTNTPYYSVHVRVSLDELEKAGNLKLQAGMPAEVFIRTSSRNALQYFLDPITGFLQRSMREQ
jgi:HlyD family type I secretion membrane fusion protein